MSSTATETSSIVQNSDDRKTKFLAAWPGIRDELVAFVRTLGLPDDVCTYFSKILDYNVPHGKLNRGRSVVDSIEIFYGRPLTDTEYYEGSLLGWCIELLQAMFLVSDDIMDASITRRGQPCWYKLPDVGNKAINDGFVLRSAIFFLLKKHLRSHPAYIDIVELFQDITLMTEIGQLIDLMTAPEDVVDLSKFSLDRHQQIVIFKTSYYSFYLPVACAMRYAGITDEKDYAQAKSILIPLGEYFQIQDDYLDCYGTPEQIGKIGTDIIDNKCSWLINVALSLANKEDRAALDENYGRKDPASEKRVKDLFVKLGVEAKYLEYEEESYRRISGLIDQIDESQAKAGTVSLKRDVFYAFLHKIYKRTK